MLLECYRDLPWYYHQSGQDLQAYRASTMALDHARSLFKANDAWRNREAFGRSLCDTAAYLAILDRLEEASALYEESLSIFRPLIPFSSVHEEETLVRCMLASLENLYRRGMFNEAISLGQEVLAISHSLRVKDPGGTISATMILLGMCQKDQNKWSETISLVQEALTLSDKVADSRPPLLDFILTQGHATLGIALMAAGHREQGISHCDEVLRYSYSKLDDSESNHRRRERLSYECLQRIADFIVEEMSLFYEAHRFSARAEELSNEGPERSFVMTWGLWQD